MDSALHVNSNMQNDKRKSSSLYIYNNKLYTKEDKTWNIEHTCYET